jgi:hypothetical protein
MSLTYSQATDELFGMVKAVFDNSNSLIGYIPDLRWPGIPRGDKPDDTKYWARPSAQWVTDQQSALANDNGTKIYEAVGLLYVQLFAPLGQANSPEKLRALGEMLQAKFRSQSDSSEIWFRNQRIIELPEDSKNYKANFVTQFTYKTLQERS